jgi:hypothetical protein
MPLDENSHQLLGSMDLNLRDLYDVVGKQYGRLAELCPTATYI